MTFSETYLIYVFMHARCLSNQCACVVALIAPGGRKLLRALVVAGKAMDATLNEDKAELGVEVFSIFLEVLAHVHCLLYEMV